MSDIFATTDGLILNIIITYILSSSIAEPNMKQKKACFLTNNTIYV